jgi:hypothetical protein
MTLCDVYLYSLDSINARSKILRVDYEGFTEITKRIEEMNKLKVENNLRLI